MSIACCISRSPTSFVSKPWDSLCKAWFNACLNSFAPLEQGEVQSDHAIAHDSI